jgi:D-threo-aldose 1-dehydrogenase
MVKISPVVFGTSGLGNLFELLSEDTKLGIVRECIDLSPKPAIFDSAGKYGAGLALEVLGRSLRQLNVSPDQVVISNKLGWLRSPLNTPEPTFEPGVWKGLEYDAVQKISYDGILECFEQGNQLLNGYIPDWVSVHDPDEYLARAASEAHAIELYDNILGAYKALFDLRRKGVVKSVGVGAKNWRTVRRIAADVPLDWVMIANSMTVMQHPGELMEFVADLKQKGILVINAAVFHSGFLTGGDYYDYRKVSEMSDPELYAWRSRFYDICSDFGIEPAAACIRFALSVPGVSSIALSAIDKEKVKENLDMARSLLPCSFWGALKDQGLIRVPLSWKL